MKQKDLYQGGFMNTHVTLAVDNRDAGQMYEYLEARIDVLKRRIGELEKENQVLRFEARRSEGLLADQRGRRLAG
jgi:hypothetical protein